MTDTERSNLQTQIRLYRSRAEKLESENESLKQLLDLIDAWDKEESAAHRHAKLMEIMGFVRKARRK